jgi:hypothetical protein
MDCRESERRRVAREIVKGQAADRALKKTIEVVVAIALVYLTCHLLVMLFR